MSKLDLVSTPEFAEEGPVVTSTSSVFAQVLAPDEVLMPDEAL
jgi:hypothetical protein